MRLVLSHSAPSLTSSSKHPSTCHQFLKVKLSVARFQSRVHSLVATFLILIWKKVQRLATKTRVYFAHQNSKIKFLRIFLPALVWVFTVWGCNIKMAVSLLYLDRDLKLLKLRWMVTRLFQLDFEPGRRTTFRQSHSNKQMPAQLASRVRVTTVRWKSSNLKMGKEWSASMAI